MKIDPNIHGSIIKLQDLKPIQILECTPGASVTVNVSAVGYGLEIEDIFYPDNNLEISVDVETFVSAILQYDDSFISQLSESSPIVSHWQKDSAVAFRISALSSDSTEEKIAIFLVTPYSASGKSSDISQLTVPRDYVVPMQFPEAFLDADGKTTMTAGETSIEIEVQQSTPAAYPSSTVNLLCRLKDAGVQTMSLKNLSVTVIDSLGNGSDPVSSPLFVFSDAHFEQYLFRNRFGGFDNIPMSGARKLIPEYTFGTGVIGGSFVGTDRTGNRFFSQDTGYLSRQTMEILSELILSGDIYHLDKGIFRRIVITESTADLSSADTIHSASFTYRYSDEI